MAQTLFQQTTVLFVKALIIGVLVNTGLSQIPESSHHTATVAQPSQVELANQSQ